MAELLPLLFFLLICAALMLGYPVALTLTGVSLAFAGLGLALGAFDIIYLELIPNRLYGILTNQNLLAVPLFVFFFALGIVIARILKKTSFGKELDTIKTHGETTT